jgi:hypothetical protein
MTADRDLGRRLADHFAVEAPRLAPDWVLPAALTTIETTRQRRGLLAPWRFNPMPTYAKLGVAVAAALAVAVVAWQLRSSNVAHPTTSPTPSSSIAAPSIPPAYSPPPLTQTFASTRFGLSLNYPEGWKATPGRTVWTLDNGAYREPLGDLFEDPARQNLFLKAASLPIGSLTLEQLAAMAFTGRSCSGPGVAITIHGVQGLVNNADNCLTAVVVSGGRGYLIGGHWDNNLAELRSIDWSGWFMDVLATVQLEPDKAVDTP